MKPIILFMEDHNTLDRKLFRIWMGERNGCDVAKLIGCDNADVYHYLDGTSHIGRSRAKRWSEVTGIPEEVFILRKEIDG